MARRIMMGDSEAELLSSLFSFPDGIVIQRVQGTTELLVIEVACSQHGAACPLCQHFSERLHGHYVRTVVDVNMIMRVSVHPHLRDAQKRQGENGISLFIRQGNAVLHHQMPLSFVLSIFVL